MQSLFKLFPYDQTRFVIRGKAAVEWGIFVIDEQEKMTIIPHYTETYGIVNVFEEGLRGITQELEYEKTTTMSILLLRRFWLFCKFHTNNMRSNYYKKTISKKTNLLYTHKD